MVTNLKCIQPCPFWSMSKLTWLNFLEFIEKCCFIDDKPHITTEQQIISAISIFEKKTGKTVIESIIFFDQIMNWLAIRLHCAIATDEVGKLYIFGGLWL